MAQVTPLSPDALYQHCESHKFTFQTTADLEDLTEFVGQARAAEAIQFGVGIRRQGFNLYLLGPSGMGKYATVRAFLEKIAAAEPASEDWCYVNNFAKPETPRVLKLPAGSGVLLREDVHRLVDNLRSAIRSAFESESYSARKHVIEQEIKERQDKAFEEIQQEADQKDIAVLRTPTGLALAPMRNGKVLSPEQFENLPEAEHQTHSGRPSPSCRKNCTPRCARRPAIEQEGRERIRQLSNEVASFAVGHLIDELRKKYAGLPEVVSFLDDMQADIIENVDEFLTPARAPAGRPDGHVRSRSRPRAWRLPGGIRSIVLVDHSGNHGAPVVYEDHPTYQNLVGQVEYMSHLGAVTTDFNLIRPGALHRANGGYLILDALKVLLQPFAWEALKRSLRSSQIRIESLGQMLSLMSTVSLEPQPIPLNVKVVLVGERLLYYLLCSLDPEFNELFKVAADFEERMPRNAASDLLYARAGSAPSPGAKGSCPSTAAPSAASSSKRPAWPAIPRKC